MTPMIPVAIKFPSDLKALGDRFASDNGTTFQQVVRDSLELYVNNGVLIKQIKRHDDGY